MRVVELTNRQNRILRYLVEEYVSSGRPVGSKTLIEQYPLNVSSATVRNEMAVLESEGLVEHPHRSAGSIPTDKGLRQYVERYATASSLPTGDQLMIRHQFRQVESQLESWLHLAASVLAEIAGNLSMVTSPRNRQTRLRHFELLSLQPRVALLIVVTQDSAVSQSMIHLDEPVDQEVLSATADRLNAVLNNRTPVEAQEVISSLEDLDQVVASHVLSTLESSRAGERTEVRHEGLEYMVRQPEFQSDDELRGIFGLMRGGALLSLLLPQIDLTASGVQVFIGEENRVNALQPFGIVVSSYGIDERVTGLVGIVGPRRMHYARSISTVRYMADLMSDMMHELYYRE